MKAIVLAAGYGTRLYPLTLDLPKALLKIGNKFVLEFILEKIKKIKNIEETILVSNNKFFFLFDKWVKEHNLNGIKIINDLTNSEEERLGALGDLDFVIQKNKINTDILLIAGDNLFDFSLKYFVKTAQKKYCISIGIYDIKDRDKAKRFGVVEIDSRNYVIKFVEKPEKPFSTLVGIGIYFIPANKLKLIKEYLKKKYSHDALGHFMEYLLKKKERIYGYRFNGRWFDIGDRKAYREAKNYFEQRRYYG